MSLDEMIEPRTNADIVRDLLSTIREREWLRTYDRCPRGCCGEWSEQCPECGAHEGSHDEDGYQVHKPGCRTAALITETEAFLAVEESLLDR